MYAVLEYLRMPRYFMYSITLASLVLGLIAGKFYDQKIAISLATTIMQCIASLVGLLIAGLLLLISVAREIRQRTSSELLRVTDLINTNRNNIEDILFSIENKQEKVRNGKSATESSLIRFYRIAILTLSNSSYDKIDFKRVIKVFSERGYTLSENTYYNLHTNNTDELFDALDKVADDFILPGKFSTDIKEAGSKYDSALYFENENLKSLLGHQLKVILIWLSVAFLFSLIALILSGDHNILTNVNLFSAEISMGISVFLSGIGLAVLAEYVYCIITAYGETTVQHGIPKG